MKWFSWNKNQEKSEFRKKLIWYVEQHISFASLAHSICVAVYRYVERWWYVLLSSLPDWICVIDIVRNNWVWSSTAGHFQSTAKWYINFKYLFIDIQRTTNCSGISIKFNQAHLGSISPEWVEGWKWFLISIYIQRSNHLIYWFCSEMSKYFWKYTQGTFKMRC